MFEDLGPLRDSIRDVILTSDADMGMIRLTLCGSQMHFVTAGLPRLYTIMCRDADD